LKIIQHYFPNLNSTQLEQFEKLLPLYAEWNEKINVISRKDVANFYERHVLHSLSIAKVIQFEKGEKIGVTTNNVAEYTAVVAALSYLLESPTAPTMAKFFLDSKLVVEQINGNYQIKQSHLQELCSQIQQLRKRLPYSTVFSHVPRKDNARADFLVNLALDSS